MNPSFHTTDQMHEGLPFYSENYLELQDCFLANGQSPIQQYAPNGQYNEYHAEPVQVPALVPVPVRQFQVPFIPSPQTLHLQNPAPLPLPPLQYTHYPDVAGYTGSMYGMGHFPYPFYPLEAQLASAPHSEVDALSAMAALSLEAAAMHTATTTTTPPAPSPSAPTSVVHEQAGHQDVTTVTGLPRIRTNAHYRFRNLHRGQLSSHGSSSMPPHSPSPSSSSSSFPSSPSSYASSQPPSTPSSLSAHFASSPPPPSPSTSARPGARVPCPHDPACPARFSRPQDAWRHVESVHLRTPEDWLCCGLPVALRACAPGEPAAEYNGLAVAGGCGAEHSRVDALRRHLDENRGRCVGDPAGRWMVGVQRRPELAEARRAYMVRARAAGHVREAKKERRGAGRRRQ
ncbi:uncharacterized protein BXZ73DRAFT_75293 [Epithele typhae]|uniref:uncharacterized protein n=1 Tax=Epithele typhae TaxID=378194 RepID=UPI002008E47E|nr:uncharacterized protein BXZ73DRAFT_75293 [Epithele typhae]KAH9940742.1 hypothetical protein BXZ73DRAFT_75293 [Epithele typhae]